MRAAPRTGVVVLRYLRYLDECQLHQQPLVAALPVVDVAPVGYTQHLVEKLGGALGGLRAEFLPLLVAHVEQGQRGGLLGHHHVAHMLGQAVHQVDAVETAAQDVVQQQHHVGHLVLQTQVDDAEVVVAVEHVQVLYHLVVGQVALAVAHRLVEDGERVAHAAVGLLGYHVQRLLVVGESLAVGHTFQMAHDVGHAHAVEVVDLAARDDGGQNLVLLGGGQDEDHIRGRLLERLEEGVEGGRR